MNTQEIMNYLTGLSENNCREWYHAHKAEYKAANAAFEQLLSAMISKIGTFDPQVLDCVPGELTFKLVRDTRFSHDKSPYNPAFRAHISAQGKQPVPVGYYLMLKPGNQSFLGGGLFADMFQEATQMVRSFIAAHPDEWQQTVHAPEFERLFTVRGTTLKRMPRGYETIQTNTEFLKMKSWYLEYPLSDQLVGDADALLARATDIFEKMKPFNDLLNRALEGFQMPERP